MVDSANKNLPMTYEEALKYREQHRIITNIDILNLESQCEGDKPSNLGFTLKDFEAQEVVKEHRIQEFLDYNFKLS